MTTETDSVSEGCLEKHGRCATFETGLMWVL